MFGIDGIDLDFDFIGIDLYLPVSPTLYMLFSVVFGGVGLILVKDKRDIPYAIIVIIALIAGVIVALLMSRLIIKPLKNAQNTSTPNSEELVGLNALVNEKIFSQGYGEIKYSINGNSYTSPAKSIHGEEITVGTEVTICWIEDYVFYVMPLRKKIQDEESIQDAKVE